VGLLVSAALFTAVYEPLRRVSARLLDQWLDVAPLDISARLLEFSQLNGRHPRLDAFFQASCERLRKEHGLELCQVLLPDQMGHLSVFASDPSLPLSDPIKIDPEALGVLATDPGGLDSDQLTWVKAYERGEGQALSPAQARLRETMRALDAQCLYALRSGNGKPLGLLAIGRRKDGRGFRPAERAFFAALASLFSASLENALLQGQVRHADRLQSLGTLAAGLAHELRNPLSSILVFVQMLPERFHDAGFREKFNRVVQQELNKLNRLTEQLLQISRPGGRAALPLDLSEQLQRARQLVAYQYRRKGVKLEIACEDAPWVRGAADELSQVFLNLLLNALAVSEARPQRRPAAAPF
jgi:signal transduction histidine kinase